MSKVLHQELFRLTQVQIFVMVLYTVLMRYFLESLGFTRDMISIFQIMCVGYSAYAIGNSFMLLQLYFNDRKGALFTCAVYFSINLIGTLLTMNRPPLYYGLGMTLAGMMMYLIGLTRLLVYVGHIDYHIFCGQPVLMVHKEHWLGKLAARLDSRANKLDKSPSKQAEKKDKHK